MDTTKVKVFFNDVDHSITYDATSWTVKQGVFHVIEHKEGNVSLDIFPLERIESVNIMKEKE